MKTVLYFRLQWRLCQRYADGVFRYARKAGWRVQLIDTVRNTPPARQAIDWWRADGCIVDWLFMDYIGWTPDVFADLPTVFIDASRTEPYRLCSSVDHDAVDCVRMATDELLALGYENYAYVGTIADFDWEKLRRTAFERRMAAAGKRCLMFRPVQAKGFDVFYSELGPWLASLPRPCGIFAANDKVASRVLNACELARIKVPESIAVVGVDDDEMICENTEPTLSSVLNDLDLLVMPGGMSGTIVGEMGQKGVENLKDFVRRGGSYVGLCAGNVILLDDEYRVAYGMGMVPYSRYGAYSGDAMTSVTLTDEGAKALGMEKGTFNVWYSGGPIMFRRHDEVPDAKIETWGIYAGNVTNEGWGAHMVGNVACLGGTYGKGRIAATACHPEFRHSAEPFLKGLFRYAARREVTFPEPKVNPGAKKVYYYSWPVAGKECARFLTEIDADPDIDVHTDERDEMCGGALDAFDALVIPDGADWQLSHDMFPPEVEAAIAAYAAKGGKVYSWGASVRHLPKGGIACRSTYDAYARLKAGK